MRPSPLPSLRAFALRSLALLLAAAALAAGSPACAITQHDEARWGVRRLAYDLPIDDADPWLPEQLAEMRAGLPALSNWGPTVVEVDPGSTPRPRLIRPFNSMAMDPQHRRCGSGSGYYDAEHDVEYCDPVCIAGFPALRQCQGHEWGHGEGLHHVCAPHATDATCDPQVPPDYGLMNALLGYDLDVDPTTTVDPGAVASDAPSQGDLDEWNATHGHADAGP